jgi:hypothetical protein
MVAQLIMIISLLIKKFKKAHEKVFLKYSKHYFIISRMYENHPALFLDRDGVINIDKGYVVNIDDFQFIDGIFSLLKNYQGKGYKLIIITNQSGIGRGLYTNDDFLNINNWMLNRFGGRWYFY